MIHLTQECLRSNIYHMLEINKTLPRGDIYPAELVSKGLPPILFDIETTGLGAKTAYIYLIGALEIKRDRLVFRQWFAEGPADEKLLIESFLSWLPDRSCLISFNGRGFDVTDETLMSGRHIGIRNVRERIEKMCGGRLEVVSEPDMGCTVTIRIPVKTSPGKR